MLEYKMYYGKKIIARLEDQSETMTPGEAYVEMMFALLNEANRQEMLKEMEEQDERTTGGESCI